MAKNLIPEIAHMLGVEMGEEFKLSAAGTTLPKIFKFNGHVLWSNSSDGEHGWFPTPAHSLLELIYGDFEIIKLPWKLKQGDTYYSFYRGWRNRFGEECDANECVWKVTKYFWCDSPFDFGMIKVGWVFRTREEAEAILPTVAKELRVMHQIGRENDD